MAQGAWSAVGGSGASLAAGHSAAVALSLQMIKILPQEVKFKKKRETL